MSHENVTRKEMQQMEYEFAKSTAKYVENLLLFKNKKIINMM